MTKSIGSAIAAAAVMAIRSLGAVQATLALMPPPAASARGRDGAPTREAAFIKVEININR